MHISSFMACGTLKDNITLFFFYLACSIQVDQVTSDNLYGAFLCPMYLYNLQV